MDLKNRKMKKPSTLPRCGLIIQLTSGSHNPSTAPLGAEFHNYKYNFIKKRVVPQQIKTNSNRGALECRPALALVTYKYFIQKFECDKNIAENTGSVFFLHNIIIIIISCLISLDSSKLIQKRISILPPRPQRFPLLLILHRVCYSLTPTESSLQFHIPSFITAGYTHLLL